MTVKLLSAEGIEALEKMQTAAAPAPWSESYGHLGNAKGHSLADEAGWFPHAADAALIAAARNALPALLDEVRRSRALLKRIEWIRSDKGWLVCPACDQFEPVSGAGMPPPYCGHKPDCELASLIEDASKP